MTLRRVAIYGGTFDPVHNGHIEAARAVQKFFELDQVIFVPAGVPPHKRNAKITSAFHRFAMLALATEMDRRLLVSTIELDAPAQPYAVETVTRVREELRAQVELFFLMGADSWLDIKSWHEWRRLMQLCSFIIVTRPGYELGANATADIPIPVVNVRGVGCRQGDNARMTNDQPQAFVTDVVMLDINATGIRAAARAKDIAMLKTMVPEAVANYIEKYELYEN